VTTMDTVSPQASRAPSNGTAAAAVTSLYRAHTTRNAHVPSHTAAMYTAKSPGSGIIKSLKHQLVTTDTAVPHTYLTSAVWKDMRMFAHGQLSRYPDTAPFRHPLPHFLLYQSHLGGVEGHARVLAQPQLRDC
jgi:hypothetical protein